MAEIINGRYTNDLGQVIDAKTGAVVTDSPTGGAAIPVGYEPTILSTSNARNVATKDATTLQNAEASLANLQQRIATEGITDASGKQVLAPGAYNPSAGVLKNISGSPAVGTMVDDVNRTIGAGNLGGQDADRLSSIQSTQDSALAALAAARGAADAKDYAGVNGNVRLYEESRKKFETDLADYFKSLAPLRTQALSYLSPSAREQEVAKQLKSVRMEAESFGLQTEKDKLAEFEGQTLGFARGRASEIDFKASFRKQEQALQEKNLLLELGLEREAREMGLKTVGAQLGYLKDDFELQSKVEDKLLSMEENILEKADKLEKEQKDTLFDFLEALDGVDPSKISPESAQKLYDLSRATGIPFELVEEALQAQWSRTVFDRAKNDLLSVSEAKELGVPYGTTKTEAAKKETEEKPLSILDVQRYQELYPNAGIVAGDSEAVANTKVSALQSGREYTDEEIRKLVNEDKIAGATYEQVIQGIDSELTIKNKDRAKLIAGELYGKAENTELEKEIAELQRGGILTAGDIRAALRKRGYSDSEINKSSLGSVGSLIESLTNFMFK